MRLLINKANALLRPLLSATGQRMHHDKHVRSVGVIAAWCETETHFVEPCVEEYLSAPQHRKLCEYLARGVQSTEGSLANTPGSQPRGLTTAQISQCSVDLLLREYYQMVQSQHRPAKHVVDGSGGLFNLFLLLCPAGPDCCDLRHIAAAVACITRTAATLVVLLACVFVPGWLAVIRELLQQHQSGPAAAVAVAGLSVMLLSDIVNRSVAAERRAAAAVAVTPGTVQQLLSSGAGSSELSTLRLASKSITTLNSSTKQALGQQQQQQSLQQAATSAHAPGGPSAPSYMSLLPELAALQSALGVSSEPPTSRERLAEEIKRVCDVLGCTVTPDMLASPAAMAATIASLKDSVGV